MYCSAANRTKRMVKKMFRIFMVDDVVLKGLIFFLFKAAVETISLSSWNLNESDALSYYEYHRLNALSERKKPNV